jgi:hypothetical protein
MEGLRHLVMGAAQCYLGLHEEAVASFRTCLAKRGELEACETRGGRMTGQTGDHHISAFALYELGTLLCKDPKVSKPFSCLYTLKNSEIENQINSLKYTTCSFLIKSVSTLWNGCVPHDVSTL